MDAITLLKDDHKLVKRLFREFKQTTDRAVKTRERLCRRMVKELSIHAAIEEMLLYPRLRSVLPKGDKLADHAIEEHQEAKELLAKIDGMSGDDPELAPTVEKLAAAITAHVKEEEGDLFKQLRAKVGRKDLAEWGEELKAARKTAPTHPHPHAPNKPPGNVLVGAAAGTADRAKDKAAAAR
ncbi:MAG TPA: hemerythrin domain-containing protein [Acidimicrobiales bacterium]